MKFLALALALTSAAADFSGIYVSYPIGADDPSRIVDRYEARQEGDTLTFWKSGAHPGVRRVGDRRRRDQGAWCP